MAAIDCDLCIIGGGSAGLSVASGAAQLGRSTVLIEGHEMGGDCLNYGCVPSKALIAAGRRAQAIREAAAFGIAAQEPEIDYAAAMDHVARTIAAIAPHDSQARFEGLGVRVIRDWGRFTGPREVAAGPHRIRARRFVIATGSAPAIPPIPGLAAVPYLTNETLWANRARPAHLLVIGGGPIGLELAQAHRRLGAAVTVLEADRALAKEDPEIAAVALARLRAEGVEIREGATVTAVSGTAGAITLTVDGAAVTGSHLLVATGRRPSIDRLDLDAGGIAHDARGIAVTPGLRSRTNTRVYAIGDVAGGLQFTHVAGYHASLVIRNALFRLPVRENRAMLPRATYTEPEIAHIGLTEAEARDRLGARVEVHRAAFADNDRARAEGATEGFAKLVACDKGRVHGVSIVGALAGELIQPWALALSAGLKIKDVAGHVAPYPTLGEVSKRVAGAYFAPRLFGDARLKWALRQLARLG